MRARHYDPNSGRFLQEDPIGTSDDINLYRYVANNPMKYVDRFGLEKLLLGAIYNAKSVQVDLVARALNIDYIGGGGVHTFIKFTITDNFGNVGIYSIGGHKSKSKMLEVRFNDSYDAGWKKSIKSDYRIPTPSGISDKEFAAQLVNEAIFYDNNQKEYSAMSTQGEGGTSGNCNNFSTTILARGSNYSSDIISITQNANPLGLNPGLGEVFSPICTNN